MTKDLIAGLRDLWRKHTNCLDTDDQNRNKIFDAIVTHYSETERHYHTLAHLKYFFGELDRLRKPPARLAPLHFAAWFHDIIYNTKRFDNEEKSADFSGDALQSLGAPLELIAHVRTLILATKAHQISLENEIDNFFLDADFSILGADGKTYDQYALDIRTEFHWVPDLDFAKARIGFLSSALERERIFLTDDYEIPFGNQARTNLKREVAVLTRLIR